MASHKVFVCAATGTQGGAVSRQLRALGWEVRTTTRKADSPAAQALASIGVHVHQGAWSDLGVLETAIADCDLLFLNLMPDLANPVSELVDGKNIIRIAKAAGVKQVVYSSAMRLSAMEANPLYSPVLEFKKALELEVRNAGFQHWTIQRPGFFMANFLAPKVNMLYPGAADTGLFAFAFRPGTQLPLIDHEDIAGYVVAAFQNPDKFHGHDMRVVSEVLTVERCIETMHRGTGRNIRAKYLTDDEIKEAAVTQPLLAIQQAIRDSAEFAANDAEENAERWGVKVGTFERFVEREKKAFDETFPNA